ncbi:unnamed protein product [Enterobius vermicularis]|uniref:Radical SAM protein n=1 Tax=Enterobius vermicularis TaxID=51028 RepID=A0A0N4UZ06_ENTVE|nr:unnamed protein product [Enterobius vermicularis]
MLLPESDAYCETEAFYAGVVLNGRRRCAFPQHFRKGFLPGWVRQRWILAAEPELALRSGLLQTYCCGCNLQPRSRS